MVKIEAISNYTKLCGIIVNRMEFKKTFLLMEQLYTEPQGSKGLVYHSK